jgi:hypothetical protein
MKPFILLVAAVCLIALMGVAVADDPYPSCMLWCSVWVQWDGDLGCWAISYWWEDSKRHSVIALLTIWIYGDPPGDPLKVVEVLPYVSGMTRYEANPPGGKYCVAHLEVACTGDNYDDDWDMAEN